MNVSNFPPSLGVMSLTSQSVLPPAAPYQNASADFSGEVRSSQGDNTQAEEISRLSRIIEEQGAIISKQKATIKSLTEVVQVIGEIQEKRKAMDQNLTAIENEMLDVSDKIRTEERVLGNVFKKFKPTISFEDEQKKVGEEVQRELKKQREEWKDELEEERMNDEINMELEKTINKLIKNSKKIMSSTKEAIAAVNELREELQNP